MHPFSYFPFQLFSHLDTLLTHLLAKGLRPESPWAHITVITKPGKDPTCWSSFYPIFLLNINVKLYSRFLATGLLPLLTRWITCWITLWTLCGTSTPSFMDQCLYTQLLQFVHSLPWHLWFEIWTPLNQYSGLSLSLWIRCPIYAYRYTKGYNLSTFTHLLLVIKNGKGELKTFKLLALHAQKVTSYVFILLSLCFERMRWDSLPCSTYGGIAHSYWSDVLRLIALIQGSGVEPDPWTVLLSNRLI